MIAHAGDHLGDPPPALVEVDPRPRDVEAKTNEIPMSARLLDHVEFTDAVVTADAMHAQRAHAEYLVVTRGAHFVLTVKRNQPHLHAQLAALPWREVPVGDTPASEDTDATNGGP